MKKINIVVDNKYEFDMGENEPIYRTADIGNHKIPLGV
jgi:hypothetical protein